MTLTPEQTVAYFRLGGARLYQPDGVLQERLVDGTGRLAAYVKTLAWVGSQYFGGLARDFGSMGVLIGVGVLPGERTRLWCETVDGSLPEDIWRAFVDLLEGAGANVRPQVTGPVAFAIEGLLGAGPTIPFPEIPSSWRDAAMTAAEPLSVPDGLFPLIFPA
jgi:hypothetical protein